MLEPIGVHSGRMKASRFLGDWVDSFKGGGNIPGTVRSLKG